jgi:F0F1-type ATP synthase assembly protein I
MAMGASDRQDGWRKLWRIALSTTTIGWEVAVSIFGGVLLGHYLDQRWGTGYTFTLGFLLLGLAGAAYSVARLIRRIDSASRDDR